MTRWLAALRHRGPDAAGWRAFDACTLAHTRLRIIDLSEAADQPIANEGDTVWVIFNGEIYNYVELRNELIAKGHRFRSATDGEVLVHLYEEHEDELVHRLRGMYAFAVWDDRRKRLLLSRDRLGIKPLYYRPAGDGVAFASEVGALDEASDAIDPAAVASYLRLGWVSAPNTIFSSIKELPPGHVLTWEAGRRTINRWWEVPHVEHGRDTDAELADALRDAANRHLVADVPVGVFLSSGLDSAGILRLAANAQHDIRAYTVAVEGADESVDAARIARDLGSRHEVVEFRADDIIDALPAIISAMDQPTVDGINSWVVSKAVREAGCTVALSGLGGDELFAGYSTFRRVPLIKKLGRATRWLPTSSRARLGDFVPRLAPSIATRRATEAVIDGSWSSAYAAMRGVTSRREFRSLSAAADSDGLDGLEVYNGRDDDAVTQLELRNYLPNQLLRDTDAMSMAHSLEVRVPLLDDAVVDVALRYPTDGEGRAGKPRLAAAIHPRLVEMSRQPKKTFTLPFDRWLRGPLQQQAHAGLGALLAADVGVEQAGVAQLWERWQTGRAAWRTIWAPAVLGLWLDARRSNP